MKTYTGNIDPSNMKAEDFSIDDIAQGLSGMVRFSGQSEQFWSVAAHSIVVSRIAPDSLKLAALLHDSSEAYVCDLARSIKYLPELVSYRELEKKWMVLIAHKFNICYDDFKEIKIEDDLVGDCEKQILFKGENGPYNIHVMGEIHKLLGKPREFIRDLFLSEFERLNQIKETKHE